MKRKTIAVCITGFDLEYEMRVVDGVTKRCKELGLNCLVFFNPTRKPQRGLDLVLSDTIINGEMQVFRIMNYDLIDGIVTFGESLLDENTFFDIAKKAREKNIPLIDVDDLDHDQEKRIILSNKYAMEAVLEHLITEHGLTKIDFIGGFKDNNIQSEERLEAYKTTLKKHGIPVEDDRIYFGEFWRKAIECTEEIIKKPDLPEAIVCANDTMAFFCMDTLKEHGYKIPEDVIVTGFDAVSDCQSYTPSPTTVRRATFESGEKAVDLILEMINGNEPEDITYVDSVLVKGQSCGCLPSITLDDISYNERYSKYQDFKEFTRYILDMNVDFSVAEESNELFAGLTKGAKIFKFNKLFLCINSELEAESYDLGIDEEIKPWTVPEKMVSMYNYGHEIPIGTEFPTSQLIPEALNDTDEALIYAFAPIYFKNTFLGYLAAEPSTIELEGDLLSTWLTAISNNAGSFYMNKKLEKALDELEMLNLHDPLTGMFNRRGLNKYEKDFLQNTIKSGKYLSVICADVDGLKIVNDAYGHEEGDNAITKCSDALLDVFPSSSISVRTGGDEFLILAAFDDLNEPDRLIKVIYERMEDYNRLQVKPYKVGCSCGHVTLKPDENTDLNTLKNEADSMMYLEKHKRKTVRKY